jgi:diguanylate cyclase (GGDEF)-like protein
MRRLSEEAAVLGREGRPLGLVMVDLDHFKRVNDEHGHPAGDRVLREAAQRLARTARTVDSVGRFGGEEFAWLLPDSSPDETLAAAHRLADALRAEPFSGNLRLTASIGVGDLAAAHGDPDRLVERADAALYWAKGLGRDAVLAWSDEAARQLARARSATGPHEARLAALAELCDDGGHGRRVADLAFALAERLDWAPAQQARLHQAALLHDLGKALLPAALLERPGALGPAEMAHLRQHPALGAALAGGVLDGEQRAWIRAHHERPNGTGYPAGAGAGDLPAGAQLIGLADAWDAMTTDRNHQPAAGEAEALAEIDRCAGTQLLPEAGALLRDALRWWRAEAA